MSVGKELEAMERIKETLFCRHPWSEDLIRPTIFKLRSLIPDDPDIDRMLRTLQYDRHLGGQYSWLASFVKTEGLSELELSIHLDDKAASFLKNSVVKKGGYWVLAENTNNQNLRLFENFRFPLLGFTKKDMHRISVEHNFADIMEMTWFCHSPRRDGQPCGHCNPCQYTKQEGLGRRVRDMNLLEHLYYQAVTGAKRMLKPAISKYKDIEPNSAGLKP